MSNIKKSIEKNTIKIIDDFFDLKSQIEKMFDIDLYDGLNDYRGLPWQVDDASVFFNDEDERYNGEEFTYSEELNHIKRHDGFVIINIRTCTGDGNSNLLFSEEDEISE